MSCKSIVRNIKIVVCDCYIKKWNKILLSASNSVGPFGLGLGLGLGLDNMVWVSSIWIYCTDEMTDGHIQRIWRELDTWSCFSSFISVQNNKYSTGSVKNAPAFFQMLFKRQKG